MGLFPAEEHIETLDLSSFRKAVRHIHRAGIARNIGLSLGNGSGEDLERTLTRLNLALEESPVPEFEWNRLMDVAWTRNCCQSWWGFSPSSMFADIGRPREAHAR